MRNTNINQIWEEQERSLIRPIRRLVYLDLLYRAHIGLQGTPAKRFLVLEIPESSKSSLIGFIEPKGIGIKVESVGNEKPGHVSCEITSTSSDMNDIFSIVAEDILNALSECRSQDKYVDTLKNTILRWKEFFANKAAHLITGIEAVGLMGELKCIYDLTVSGVLDAVSVWNGPLKSAQDFQREKTAIEVKTTKESRIDEVMISSLQQLDLGKRDQIFLCAYRIEEDENEGMTIPQMIAEVEKVIPSNRIREYHAKLFCCGYNAEMADKYKQKYKYCERREYEVFGEFPRLTSEKVPADVTSASYSIRLSACDEYRVSFDRVINVFKE